jgi:Reverse transcriptase (RNA-dependent DNA polymerase)
VRGDRQVEGVDYTEKYSPVVSWSTVRMMLCLSLSQDLCSKQVDFSNAFVQAELGSDEHIYVAVPKGFAFGGSEDEETVLKLRRSLYGLVQAPLYWGNHLKDALEKEGLKQSVSDQCMFIGDDMVVLTYVDDVLFFGKSTKKIEAKIKALEMRGFKLTVEEDVYAFLGVEVTRLPSGEIELKQSGLIAKVLLTCGMTDCNTKATPCNQEPLGTNLNGEPVSGRFDYASAVGMLMYLCSNTRPDIQYAVHQCARFTHFPKKSHEDAIARICRYLQGTKEKGLRFKPDDELKLDCYVDADFAGLYNVEDVQDPVCVKSRTGFCLTLGSCPLIWVSKLQTEVAMSTTEAEYIALSQSMRELIPMRRLLKEAGIALKLDLGKPAILHSTVFEDNNGALSLALSPKITPRTKHIAVKYHHFRTSVGVDKGIILEKIDTALQKADIFTKGLSADKHQAIRKLLMGW